MRLQFSSAFFNKAPKPSLLLMDRGFFTGDVIKLMEELNVNFIIPESRM